MREKLLNWLLLFSRIVGAVAGLLLFEFQPADAQANAEPKLGAEDLTVVFFDYADGAVELRQFLTACRPPEVPNWDQGVGLLFATMRRAGLQESEIKAVGKRLVTGGTVTYDCASEVAKARLRDQSLPADWIEYHKVSLGDLDIEIVMPASQSDARLDAVRAVFAEQVPGHAHRLNCMALALPRFFPTTYRSWEGHIQRTRAAILAAGYDDATVASIVDPARAMNLMTPVTDRQAAIADCWTNRGWLGLLPILKGLAEALNTKP